MLVVVLKAGTVSFFEREKEQENGKSSFLPTDAVSPDSVLLGTGLGLLLLTAEGVPPGRGSERQFALERSARNGSANQLKDLVGTIRSIKGTEHRTPAWEGGKK